MEYRDANWQSKSMSMKGDRQVGEIKIILFFWPRMLPRKCFLCHLEFPKEKRIKTTYVGVGFHSDSSMQQRLEPAAELGSSESS